MPKAQAALSRALAIDEGNERALRLLGSLGRRRRRLTLVAAAIPVILVMLLGAGYVAWLRAEDATALTEELGSADQRSEETPITTAESEEATASPPEPETAEQVPDTAEQVAAPQDANPEVVPEGPRWVVFKPTPPNVSISVDGSPLKAYGPDFQGVRLNPGKHTFRFVGAEDCCEDRVIRRRIPVGTGEFDLLAKLRYKPATLYLKGPTPTDATVRIILPGNRAITGRIREILRIPMSSLQASAQVEIRAPGYEPYKGTVQLRAGGELIEHSFGLETDLKNP